MLKRFAKDQRAATAVEYAIMASGIALAIVAAIVVVGSEVAFDFSLIPGLFA